MQYIEVCKALANRLFKKGEDIRVSYIDVVQDRIMFSEVLNNSTKENIKAFEQDLAAKGCSNERVCFEVIIDKQ